ncbi:formate dehydrogenase [Chelativorans sp. ZYF759]|uniref:formate dehydrogenase subunit delta n=1 Tax=Chelativorans sp. ZYF759 TaxID=2692213 RepID=UPI00145D00AF|nr:formate dehydrogenase subunit delta [Chelativorans sp. ZYF759]NMG39427.1 formate dehydrogenase [Chelativorans sp. ZYF759]
MSHDPSIRAGRDKLIYMANQIATFFEAQPGDAASEGIAKHINEFWEPRMRRQFFDIVDAGGEGLKPQVVEAAKTIRRPAPEPAPAGQA